jgi:hypothetical protein
VLVAFALLPGTVRAGVYRDAGSAAFQFLKLDASAVSAALGGTSLTNPGAMGLFSNPALLSSSGTGGLSISHCAHFGSTVQNDLAYSSISAGFSWSAGIASVYTGGLELRDEASSEPAGEFSAWDLALAGAASMDLGTFDAGVSLKLLREKIASMDTWGVAADLAVRACPAQWLSASAALQNLGPDVEFDEESFRLPMTWRVGATASADLPRVGGAALSLEAWKPIDNRLASAAGLEITPLGWLDIRSGFRFASDATGFTAGAGFSSGGWALDYAWVPGRFALGDIHRVTLTREL